LIAILLHYTFGLVARHYPVSLQVNYNHQLCEFTVETSVLLLIMMLILLQMSEFHTTVAVYWEILATVLIWQFGDPEVNHQIKK